MANRYYFLSKMLSVSIDVPALAFIHLCDNSFEGIVKIHSILHNPLTGTNEGLLAKRDNVTLLPITTREIVQIGPSSSFVSQSVDAEFVCFLAGFNPPNWVEHELESWGIRQVYYNHNPSHVVSLFTFLTRYIQTFMNREGKYIAEPPTRDNNFAGIEKLF